MQNNKPHFDDLSELLETIDELTEFSDVKVDNANCQNSFGVTPLHVAATWGDINAISLLLRGGANPNATDREGCTPLHDAVEQNSYAAVKTLVEGGCLLDIKNEDGLTPVELANVLELSQVKDYFKRYISGEGE